MGFAPEGMMLLLVERQAAAEEVLKVLLKQVVGVAA